MKYNKLKQTARVITTGQIVDNNLIINQGTYKVSLTKKIKEALDNNELDLTQEHKFILVPNTLPTNGQVDNDNPPYLDFLVIGVVRNQNNVEENVVKITGKIIYENINYGYVLVKLETGGFNANTQKLKLYGTLDDSINYGKGSAVDSIYDIECFIKGNQLIIEQSWRLFNYSELPSKKQSNLIQFPVKHSLAA